MQVIEAMAKRRSDCPIACSLDLLGDRWTLLVIRDLVARKHRYGEFLASAEGIPTNILADRLKRLEQAGLVASTLYSRHARRKEYHLTEASNSPAGGRPPLHLGVPRRSRGVRSRGSINGHGSISDRAGSARGLLCSRK